MKGKLAPILALIFVLAALVVTFVMAVALLIAKDSRPTPTPLPPSTVEPRFSHQPENDG